MVKYRNLLIDEDYCRAPRGKLITRYHDYIIADKSNEGQDAPLRIDMGNPNLSLPLVFKNLCQLYFI